MPARGGTGAPRRRPPQLPRAPAASGGRRSFQSRVERGRGSRRGAPVPPPRHASTVPLLADDRIGSPQHLVGGLDRLGGHLVRALPRDERTSSSTTLTLEF